jgi:hypothetical protein
MRTVRDATPSQNRLLEGNNFRMARDWGANHQEGVRKSSSGRFRFDEYTVLSEARPIR